MKLFSTLIPFIIAGVALGAYGVPFLSWFYWVILGSVSLSNLIGYFEGRGYFNV